MLLSNRLLWLNERCRLHRSEVAKLAKSVTLVIRLEKLSVELILEVKVRVGRAKTLAVEIEAKAV